MRVADLIGGLVVLGFGIGVVFFSSELPYYSEFGPGPGFLPLWIGIALICCAIYIVINILRKSERKGSFFRPQTRLGVKMLGLIVVTLLFLPLLGFSIGFALFTGTAMRLMGRHRWVVCASTSVGIAIGIHFAFGEWLMIPLPVGIVGW